METDHILLFFFCQPHQQIHNNAHSGEKKETPSYPTALAFVHKPGAQVCQKPHSVRFRASFFPRHSANQRSGTG